MRVRVRAIHLPFVVAFALLCGSGEVRAAGNPVSCDNDIDCVATPECGGDVCTYSATGLPACTPAGTGAGQAGEGGSSADGGGGCSTSGSPRPGCWSAIVLVGLSAVSRRGRRCCG